MEPISWTAPLWRRIVTRSVSKGRRRSQPVPSLTLPVTLARPAGTSGATSKLALRVGVPNTVESDQSITLSLTK